MTKYRPKTMPFTAFIKDVVPAAVEIDAGELTAELCQRFHSVGIKVQAKVLGEKWDNPKVWGHVIDMGADWLQTDDPAGILFSHRPSNARHFPAKIAVHPRRRIVMLLKRRCPRYAQPLESGSILPRSTSARHGMENTSLSCTARSTGPRRGKGVSAKYVRGSDKAVRGICGFGKHFRDNSLPAVLRRRT